MERNKKILFILLYPLSALLTPFPRTIIIKDNAHNARNPRPCLFTTLITSFAGIATFNEEVTWCINAEAIDAINEVALSAIIVQRNPRS